MNHDYPDIRERIKEEPKWYDSNGVPRYGAFKPDLCPDIYWQEVVLMEIACQVCGRRFLVEMHWDTMSLIWHPNSKKISEWIKEDVLPHYGDPPAHGCVGDTMNCEDLQILEFWTRNKLMQQERLKI